MTEDSPPWPFTVRNWRVAYTNLGALLGVAGRLTAAETALIDCLAIRKQLAADFPARPEFLKDLAERHHNVGTVFADTGRQKEAEEPTPTPWPS